MRSNIGLNSLSVLILPFTLMKSCKIFKTIQWNLIASVKLGRDEFCHGNASLQCLVVQKNSKKSDRIIIHYRKTCKQGSNFNWKQFQFICRETDRLAHLNNNESCNNVHSPAYQIHQINYSVTIKDKTNYFGSKVLLLLFFFVILNNRYESYKEEHL